MTIRIGICLLLTALLFVSACEKLPDKSTVDRGDIAFEEMVTKDMIPAEWGRLVAVSNSSDFAHIFQLWFEDEEGAVRVAFYNLRSNEFQAEGRLIPRIKEGTDG